jgi:syntaxin of plants SYP6
LCRRQDDELDELGTAVTRIGQVGLQIHEELGQQAVLLDELDEDVEGTQNRLAAAQKKIATVLERAGLRTQLCLLVFLIVLLVILCLIAFS